MIENLETLIALSKAGTMMEASTALRISQSAVSKRIAALERYYDRDLIERHGRRVVLTHHGTRLVERVTPLLSELRSVFLEDNALRKGKIILGVSEAILASWGSCVLFANLRPVPALFSDRWIDYDGRVDFSRPVGPSCSVFCAGYRRQPQACAPAQAGTSA